MQRTWIGKTPECVGETVRINGWINGRRDHGKLIFLDLRDRSGMIQAVVLPGEEGAYEEAKTLRSEYVVEVEGLVKERPLGSRNEKVATGGVELEIKKLTVLNKAKTPPFELDRDSMEVGEETRLRYRYLDLRTERMKENMVMRAKLTKFFRDYLFGQDFIEIETPVLGKATAEGARDYIVPSRVYPGKWYALPQSPQQYKQLFMVAGLERYFQVAKCFRDEDTRGDRQPEFTQLDMEMSFVSQEDVMNIVEDMLIQAVKTLYPQKKIQQIPFPRIPYAEAMAKYGSDRPDIRTDKNDPDLLAFCWVVDFPFFEKDEESGGWTFTHNPFSAPKPEHMQDLLDKKNIADILTTQYDIVLNGYEVGGGSIRNHQPQALRAVLEIMGFSEEKILKQYGHMLKAFEYGAPPHGGIAPGLDRIVMILQGEPNIREVMAFPKTGDGRDLMMDAPGEVDPKQLAETGVKVVGKKKV
ncbi:MAG TPA: aspartate--tRNA ligase [Candidatus Moranbacteria bacterium]|nr:aspartate--tRNA ligase [Candidatus Moranbacteria bacterium]